MKQIIKTIFYILFAYIIISCNDKDDPNPPKPQVEKVNVVSQFAYDGLSTYYKWADEMKDKKPKVSDSNPQTYFKSLLNKADTKHRWSWLTDNIEGLLDNFSGKSVSFGYNLDFIQDKTDYKIYAAIKYVFPNTPASEVGIERLHLIGEIDGKPIRTEKRNGNVYIAKADIDKLNGNKGQTTYTLYKHKSDGSITKLKDVTLTPTEINTNPILLDSIYEVDNKKIGYLFYTGFIRNYNQELYKVFKKFKAKNVTDLILDLRYNRGGSLSSASYLASMIAPQTAVQGKSVLSTLSYNDFLNKLFDKKNRSRSSILGTYNPNNGEANPLTANLNLNKVYIIATNGSYSASELTTFCLKPYMNVVHIGSKTGGKYTASWTIHGYKNFPNKDGYARVNTVYDASKLSTQDKTELEHWGIQPIVAIYTDKDGKTFIDNNGLIPDYKLSEGAVKDWAPLGDTKDALLGQALYLITGKNKYKPTAALATRASSSRVIAHENTLSDKILKESVIIDDVKLSQKELQEIFELSREK